MALPTVVVNFPLIFSVKGSRVSETAEISMGFCYRRFQEVNKRFMFQPVSIIRNYFLKFIDTDKFLMNLIERNYVIIINMF